MTPEGDANVIAAPTPLLAGWNVGGVEALVPLEVSTVPAAPSAMGATAGLNAGGVLRGTGCARAF